MASQKDRDIMVGCRLFGVARSERKIRQVLQYVEQRQRERQSVAVKAEAAGRETQRKPRRRSDAD